MGTAVFSIKSQKIGKVPVVILPLADYERMQEDLEMARSKTLAKKIKVARAEIRSGASVSLRDAKTKLRLR